MYIGEKGQERVFVKRDHPYVKIGNGERGNEKG